MASLRIGTSLAFAQIDNLSRSVFNVRLLMLQSLLFAASDNSEAAAQRHWRRRSVVL
jgi:hypothetical protein